MHVMNCMRWLNNEYGCSKNKVRICNKQKMKGGNIDEMIKEFTDCCPPGELPIDPQIKIRSVAIGLLSSLPLSIATGLLCHSQVRFRLTQRCLPNSDCVVVRACRKHTLVRRIPRYRIDAALSMAWKSLKKYPCVALPDVYVAILSN